MQHEEPIWTSDPAKYNQWLTDCLNNRQNMSETERWASVAGAGLLALFALRRAPFATLLCLVGAVLGYRGLTGHCNVYEAAHINTAVKKPTEAPPVAMKPKASDLVNEASWESFPASDAPSWAGGIT